MGGYAIRDFAFSFIKTQIYVTITVTAEIEAIIHKLRVRLMDDVRRSELLES